MKRPRLIFCLLWLAAALPLWPKSVLILYDGAEKKSEAFKSARYIENALDHFSSVTVKTLLPSSEYRPEWMKDKDVVFLVFEEGEPEFPAALVEGLAAFPGDIVWIHMHVEAFLKAQGSRLGLTYDDWRERSDWEVRYKGRSFPKEDPGLHVITIAPGAPVRVLADVRSPGGPTHPYILNADHLWYVADSPFSYAMEGGRFLILLDLFHDIFHEDHAGSRKALVRIEDVNPEDDPKNIRRVADFLSSEGVPFAVSLIPIYRNPAAQSEVYLTDRPEIVAALKYAVARGATIVLHGATHQYRGSTGDDYEFWDDVAGTPFPHETPDWVGQRIELALKECFSNGIYPLAWETPHYSASLDVYTNIARYFDTFYDRIMAAEISGTQQILPFPLILKSPAVRLIPENLGYVDFVRPDPRPIIENAGRMTCVRDGLASFFFHSFVPVKHLKKIVRDMKATGWTFDSIRSFPCNLRTGSVWATSAGGEGRITLSNQYLHEKIIDVEGRTIWEEYGSERRDGVVSKKIALPAGALYVLEALDLLPEPERKGAFRSVWGALAGLFRKRPEDGLLTLTRAVVVLKPRASPEEEHDQKSFLSVLTVFGFNPRPAGPADLTRGLLADVDLLVVPFPVAAVLGPREVAAVIEFAAGGGLLITDGETELARGLGIRFEERTVTVAGVKELSFPARNLSWNPPADIHPFTTDTAAVLAEDAATGTDLAVIKPFREGKVLFFGAVFDPRTDFGFSRFPYLPQYLKGSLGLAFQVRRNDLEFYFDPGLRQNVSWEKLVKSWRAGGTRIVYLAAWHFYAAYEFDYRYFIGLCHDHGIAVYAWFELPQVTPLFWQDHPEWREKTATGADGLCHWRYQMNLWNPAAREAVRGFVAKLLAEYDWDGVNLAELNFDTNGGAADPAKFTPMNDDVRREFRALRGFDPMELFRGESTHYWKRNPEAFRAFLQFRTSMVRDLHIYFLGEIERAMREKRKETEVIVTVLDSLAHPEIIEDCGIDVRDVIALMEEHPFTLQVEDPARSWVSPPSRYAGYFELYKPLVKDRNRLMFDINCLDNRDVSGTALPSSQATGSELAATLYYAAQASGRAAIYAESTVSPADLDLLPYVLGSDVKIEGSRKAFDISTRRPVTLFVSRIDVVPFIDGIKWPFFGQRGISLPAGRSRLTFKKTGLLDQAGVAFRITFNGNISNLKAEGNAFLLKYDSPTPAALTFSRSLERISVDQADVTPPPDKAGVILPRGRHDLEIVTETPAARAVNVLGYLSSHFFYLAGLGAVLLLAGFYFFVKAGK